MPLKEFLPHQSQELPVLVLFDAVLCPASRAIRLGILEKNLNLSCCAEKLWALSDAFYTLSPEGGFPLLQDNKRIVTQTYPILEYLEAVYPSIPLLGGCIEEHAEVRRLVQWFDQRFNQEVTEAILYEKILKPRMKRGEPDAQRIKQGRLFLQDHLSYIGWLFERRNWLAGSFFSWADIFAAAHVSCLDYLGEIPWSRYNGAKDWYARIKSRPHFRAFLHEKVVDIPPAKHYSVLDF